MEKQEYGRIYEQTNRKLEKKWFPKVNRAIKGKVSSLINKIEQGGLQAGVNYLNTDLVNVRLSATVKALYNDVGMIHARFNERRLRQEVLKRFGNSDEWIRIINELLESFLLEKITYSVNKTTRDELLEVIQGALEEGLSVSETVTRLESLPFTHNQSRRIVRTEVNRAANTGIHAQGETFAYELMKEWGSNKDVRTRGHRRADHADHVHLDGQVVDFYGRFRDPRNGHLLMFPGDPEGEAEDTVLCRCFMMTKPKRDENGRLVPKVSRVSIVRDVRRPRTITI
jgi:hypothetical protein